MAWVTLYMECPVPCTSLAAALYSSKRLALKACYHIWPYTPYSISQQAQWPLSLLGSYNLSQSNFWKHLRECLVPDMCGAWTKPHVLLKISFTFTHSSQWNRWWRKEKQEGVWWQANIVDMVQLQACLRKPLLHELTVLHRTSKALLCSVKVQHLESGIWPHCTNCGNKAASLF